MTDDTQTTKLLPCPFCGGEAALWEGEWASNDHGIGCKICGLTMDPDLPCHDGLTSEQIATQAWNTRATCKKPLQVQSDCEEGLRALDRVEKVLPYTSWELIETEIQVIRKALSKPKTVEVEMVNITESDINISQWRDVFNHLKAQGYKITKEE